MVLVYKLKKTMTTDQEDFETTIIKKEIEKRKKKRLEGNYFKFIV